MRTSRYVSIVAGCSASPDCIGIRNVRETRAAVDEPLARN
jgi:hypothetical protein